ncbi:uncharacterized protein K02A2.6-like [Armigeres subalbatus]|uniref:uncharacterized protein K02A2.6-like n=1 Tax=Armigeres subalbatus TaxID=124917 RepID=UPI002ED27F2D
MKRAKLLHLGGVELQRIFRSLPDHDKTPLVTLQPKVYDLAIELLDSYFQAGRQDVIERRKLRKLKQEHNEKFSHFVIRLRQQVLNCGFEKYSVEVGEILKEIYLIDVVVENCRSDELRKAILKKDQTLREIEEIAATIENTDQQLKDLKESDFSSNTQVYGIGSARRITHKTKKFPISNGRDRSQRFGNTLKRTRGSFGQKNEKLACYSCGQEGHFSKSPECPAKGRTCRRCRGLDHFEAMCRKRDHNSVAGEKTKERRVYEVEHIPVSKKLCDEEQESNSEGSTKVYYAFYGGNESNILDCTVGGVPMEVLIDSGADANLIRIETWEMLKNEKVQVMKSTKGCSRVLKGYGSDKPLSVVGTFEAEVSIGGKVVVAEFFVVRDGQKDILGDLTAKTLGVLKVGIDINNVATELKPFSKIKDTKAQIRIIPGARPVFQPLRRIPIPMEEAVNNKLEQLLKRDIIEVKQGPATWVSPLVIVGKASGEPRICLDLRRVNEAVVREHFPMPVVDQYLARLGKGKMWSKLDIREAFHQVELEEDSRDITTFITNRGLFRFKRLPFGLVTAPEIFQRIMEEMLSGCEGTYWYLDDVIIEGETKEIHDRNLNKVDLY